MAFAISFATSANRPAAPSQFAACAAALPATCAATLPPKPAPARSFFAGARTLAAKPSVGGERTFSVTAAKQLPKVAKQVVTKKVQQSTPQYERKSVAIEDILIPPPTLSPVRSDREDSHVSELMDRIASPGYEWEPVEVYSLEDKLYLKSFKRCDRLEAAIRLGWPQVVVKIIPASEAKVNPKQYDWEGYLQSQAYHKSKEEKRAKKKDEHMKAILDAENRVMAAKAKKEAKGKKNRHSSGDEGATDA
eukprot:tig00000383_g24646.t1